MVFQRLQQLGTDKFTKICNELARGTPPVMVARLIQEWGDAHDVREDALAKQLKRLQTAILTGAFGGDLAEEARKQASVRIKALHGSTLDCLDELISVSLIQRERVLALWAKERGLDRPLPALNVAVRDCRDLILAIQKIKFDLGLDEYKRGFPSAAATDTCLTFPDGTTMEERVHQAVAQLECVFERRGIR